MCSAHNIWRGSRIVAAKILPPAIFWLPQCCPCSRIKARAAGLWQPKCCWQQHFSCHNPAVSSIMAEYLAIMLLSAGLWRSNIKALHRNNKIVSFSQHRRQKVENFANFMCLRLNVSVFKASDEGVSEKFRVLQGTCIWRHHFQVPWEEILAPSPADAHGRLLFD